MDILSLIAGIYRANGKEEVLLSQSSAILDSLVELAKVQSTEASNAIEGIVTTSTRLRQLVADKTTPRNRDEQEIMGYRDALNVIHESYDSIFCLAIIFYSYIRFCIIISSMLVVDS